MIFFTTIISCILLMKENRVVGMFNKPVLEVHTSDPYDVIMIGDKVQFHCRNSANAQNFSLMQDNQTKFTQDNQDFTIVDVKMSDSGLYTCRYSQNTDQWQYSDPEDIYVKDKYPPPEITVKPRKIVRPEEDITITCDTLYSNIKFTIYKDFSPVKESDDNPFSYVIRKAGQKDVAQYACGFSTKPGSKTEIKSDLSNPMTIKVIDLHSPSISLEVNDSDDRHVKILCQAPPTETRNMWFQLLNSNEGIEEEIRALTETHVTFNFSIRHRSQKKYYCIYAIRIGSNLALSALSNPVFIGKGYTTVNMIRLLVSAIVLILLGVILVKHFKAFQESEESLPELPRARMMKAAESEYAEMVVMQVKEDAAAPDNEVPSAEENIEKV